VLATPGFEHGHWGILVVDRKTGQTIYERNPDLLFAPASVTKLFSTAAALIELGPNFRFQTPLYRRGDVDAGGTLHGDLILLAQGDLAMGGRTGPEESLYSRTMTTPTPMETFAARWCRSTHWWVLTTSRARLRAAGIHRGNRPGDH